MSEGGKHALFVHLFDRYSNITEALQNLRRARMDGKYEETRFSAANEDGTRQIIRVIGEEQKGERVLDLLTENHKTALARAKYAGSPRRHASTP